jgi:hypothetical protein
LGGEKGGIAICPLVILIIKIKIMHIREVFGFVSFESLPLEKFRVHLNEEVGGILDYHLEARTSKKQWEGSIGRDVQVINGIPKEAVFKALKVLWIPNIDATSSNKART